MLSVIFVCERRYAPNEHWRNPDWVPPRSLIVDDVLTYPGAFAGAQKLMIHCATREARSEAQDILTKALSGRAEVADEGDWSLEVSPLGASKGAAALEICRLSGTSPEASFAFGDSGNDLSFARTPLTFVVMESSEERVRKEADYLCPDAFHDGVAVWLEAHVLSH